MQKILIALGLTLAALFAVPAEAQLTGSDSNQEVCLQLFSYFDPAAPETLALRSAMLAGGPAGALDESTAAAVEKLRDRVRRSPSDEALFRDALGACAQLIGMKGPTPRGAIVLPPADGSATRCALLMRAIEISAGQETGPGTYALIRRQAAESGLPLQTIEETTDSGARYFAATGAAGTTMKALLEEALACTSRYEVEASLVLLSEALRLGAAGSEGPRRMYCDRLYNLYGHHMPSADRFVSRLNSGKDDNPAYVTGVFDGFNYYYGRMEAAGCPAGQLGPMNAAADALLGALRTNNQAREAERLQALRERAGQDSAYDPFGE